MKSENFIFAKLEGFQADVEGLKEHYFRHVMSFPSTQYRDNRVDYVGWAVTSRDGSLEDGVRRISTKPSGNSLNKRGVVGTEICTGVLEQTMHSLYEYGVKPYRARVMSLQNEGEEMPFHVDAEKETWRLHIPIVTNENCYFEWRRKGGEIESVHLPADGSAWLVRVDVEHRAVNRSRESSERVHLLMGLNELPRPDFLGAPSILINPKAK